MAMGLPQLELMFSPWQAYEDHLYGIFLDTVVNGCLSFQGLPVKSQYRPETKGKGFSFWHLISEGDDELERIPCPRRCERIRWFAWVIENVSHCSEITWWENKRGPNTHVVIWLEQEQFAVILAKRNRYYLIKTAYVVKSKRETAFRKEREKFWRAYKG
jgi:hypothetical protein